MFTDCVSDTRSRTRPVQQTNPPAQQMCGVPPDQNASAVGNLALEMEPFAELNPVTKEPVFA